MALLVTLCLCSSAVVVLRIVSKPALAVHGLARSRTCSSMLRTNLASSLIFRRLCFHHPDVAFEVPGLVSVDVRVPSESSPLPGVCQGVAAASVKWCSHRVVRIVGRIEGYCGQASRSSSSEGSHAHKSLVACSHSAVRVAGAWPHECVFLLGSCLHVSGAKMPAGWQAHKHHPDVAFQVPGLVSLASCVFAISCQ